MTLLDADSLAELKRWTMPGKITAGPFVRAGKIGCIVSKNRLVWLDPELSDSWYRPARALGSGTRSRYPLPRPDAAGFLAPTALSDQRYGRCREST